MKVAALKIKGINTDIFFKERAFFEMDKGILGDARAKGGGRQVSILSMESRKILETKELNGLCIIKFHENITIDGLEVDKLSIGDRLEIGSTIIEITSIGKACYKECKLYGSKKMCPLVTDTVFGKVIKSGIVVVEDIITPLR